MVQASLAEKQDPISKITRAKRVNHLPSKCEAMSSNPSTTKGKKKSTKRIRARKKSKENQQQTRTVLLEDSLAVDMKGLKNIHTSDLVNLLTDSYLPPKGRLRNLSGNTHKKMFTECSSCH
jgi:hypothetical protein